MTVLAVCTLPINAWRATITFTQRVFNTVRSITPTATRQILVTARLCRRARESMQYSFTGDYPITAFGIRKTFSPADVSGGGEAECLTQQCERLRVKIRLTIESSIPEMSRQVTHIIRSREGYVPQTTQRRNRSVVAFPAPFPRLY